MTAWYVETDRQPFPEGPHLNPLLLPLKEKAVLSWILDTLPIDDIIYLRVGYDAALVRGYLAIAHPDRHFVFQSDRPEHVQDVTHPYAALHTRTEYDVIHHRVHGEHFYDYRKDQEFFYAINGYVIKIFNDASIAANRVTRSVLHPAFPTIDYHQPHLYAYRFLAGKTLYQENSPERFAALLSWLRRAFWSCVPHNAMLTPTDCMRFYQEKTYARLAQFRAKHPTFVPTQINGVPIPNSIDTYLSQLDWSRLCTTNLAARCGLIHGDLQFDNIIWTENGFRLIDWRQDFAGNLSYGDIYYDVAKLKAGLLLNHDLIKRNLFSFTQTDTGSVTFDFPHRASHLDWADILTTEFPDPMIDDIVTLIYLNMSGLHTAPYDQLLFSLALYRCATREA